MSVEKKPRNRIYLKTKLSQGALVELSSYHFNYLIKVLRLDKDSIISVFNETDGQWSARIFNVTKKSACIKIDDLQSKPRLATPLTLIFAPIKNPNSSFIVQKATELGATKIIPVYTKRTVIRNINQAKLGLIAIEATEQSERFDPPIIHQPIQLHELNKFNFDNILFCNETEKDMLALKTFNELTGIDNSILIGPEGGFDDDEIELLNAMKNVRSVSLGLNILRAETAMIAALSLYQIVRGHN